MGHAKSPNLHFYRYSSTVMSGYVYMEISCNNNIFFCKQDIQLQEEKVGDMSQGNIQCVDADHHNLHSHTLQSPKHQCTNYPRAVLALNFLTMSAGGCLLTLPHTKQNLGKNFCMSQFSAGHRGKRQHGVQIHILQKFQSSDPHKHRQGRLL